MKLIKVLGEFDNTIKKRGNEFFGALMRAYAKDKQMVRQGCKNDKKRNVTILISLMFALVKG